MNPHQKLLLIAVAALLPWALTGPADPGAAEAADSKTFKVTHQVWTTPYKSQGKTGTCWSFSTTSLLESEAHRLGRGDFELSQIFNSYHAFLEKAVRNVRLHGSGVFSDGGLPHDVIYIMKKYGAVPLAEYSGLLPGKTVHTHREMSKILRGIMDSVIKSGKTGNLSSYWEGGRLYSPWLNDMRNVLDNHLGPLPETVSHEGRRLTPRQFCDQVLDLPLDDYVEITSYSYLPEYGRGEMVLADNWLHYDDYYNVPLEDYIRILDHALKNGFSVVFDLHTTSQMYKNNLGYCQLDGELEKGTIDQDTRDTMLEDWRTFDQHLVHGIGLARDEDGGKFYFIKDSEGSEDGPIRPLEYLSENFIRAKALFFMIHKDGLPDDIRHKIGAD